VALGALRVAVLAQQRELVRWWSKREVSFQSRSLWQAWQLGAQAGLVLVVLRWQLTQSVRGVLVACRPCGRLVALGVAVLAQQREAVRSWSNFCVSFQSRSVWQAWHSRPRLPSCLSSLRWQSMQAEPSLVLEQVPVWQALQVAAAVLAAQRPAVSLSWLKVLGFQALVPWQLSHFSP
jgi:hypothetical protein